MNSFKLKHIALCSMAFLVTQKSRAQTLTEKPEALAYENPVFKYYLLPEGLNSPLSHKVFQQNFNFGYVVENAVVEEEKDANQNTTLDAYLLKIQKAAELESQKIEKWITELLAANQVTFVPLVLQNKNNQVQNVSTAPQETSPTYNYNYEKFIECAKTQIRNIQTYFKLQDLVTETGTTEELLYFLESQFDKTRNKAVESQSGIGQICGAYLGQLSTQQFNLEDEYKTLLAFSKSKNEEEFKWLLKVIVATRGQKSPVASQELWQRLFTKSRREMAFGTFDVNVSVAQAFQKLGAHSAARVEYFLPFLANFEGVQLFFDEKEETQEASRLFEAGERFYIQSFKNEGVL